MFVPLVATGDARPVPIKPEKAKAYKKLVRSIFFIGLIMAGKL
jgi:hypothetical protein